MTSADKFKWLTKNGEMASRIRAIDWSKTSLGPVESWSPRLKASINICLTSGYPMYVWWGEDMVNIYNDAYIPLAGPSNHPTFLGRPASEMWTEIWDDTLQPFLNGVKQNMTAVVHEDMLMSLERVGGVRENGYFTFSFNPALDDEGEFEGIICICNETTDKIVAQNELTEAHTQAENARKELSDFIMQAPIGIATLSGPTHVYTLINQTFMKILFNNRPVDDLLNKSVKQALPELEGQGFFEILDGVYETGKTFLGSKFKASFIQANGIEREMYINFSYQAKRNAEGKIDGILAVIYEVTDEVNEKQEIELLADNLRAAITARDNFLGIASHELNTPLTSLKLQTQMNKRVLDRQGVTAFSHERISKLLDSTIKQTERLGVLVNDMLDVSRIVSGKLTMHTAPTDLSLLIDDILERFSPQIESVGSVLKKDIKKSVVAPADSFRIEQVFTNFITNAIKYAPGKNLHATVESTGRSAIVSLRDEGNGIDEDNLGRIFGRFERATPASEVSGLGLGLFICKQIIQEHQGRISVESELGKGSTFRFEIPL